MRNVSNAFKEALANDQRNYIEYADFSFGNNVTLNLTNEHFWQNGFSYEDSVSANNKFEVGSAIVNKVNLTINNIYGDFDEYDFYGATAIIGVGLEINGTIERVNFGKFTVVDQPVYNGALISIELYDNMFKFDRPYSESSLVYPASLDTIIRDACTNCGVALSTTDFPNKSFYVAERPDDENLTYREVIAYAAQIAGCYARIEYSEEGHDGRLALRWFKNIGSSPVVAIPQELLTTKAGMTTVFENTRKDDVNTTVTGVNWFQFDGRTADPIYVNSNSWIVFGGDAPSSSGSGSTVNGDISIYKRDGQLLSLYTQEGTIGNVKFFKIRYEGYTRYESSYQTTEYGLKYELFLLSTGDMILNVIVRPTNTSYLGTSGITYSGTFHELELDNGMFRLYRNGNAWEQEEYDPTDIVIDSIYSHRVSIDDVVITGVKVSMDVEHERIVTEDESSHTETVYEKAEYLEGNEGYVIAIDNNPLIAEGQIQSVCEYLGGRLIGFSFRKASVTHGSDPSLEAGDVAYLVNGKGQTYPIIISKTKFAVGSAQNTESVAEEPVRNTSARYSVETQNYVKARKRIAKEKTQRQLIEEELNNRINDAGGLFETVEQTQGGGVITYLHNKADLAESDIQIMISSVGVMVTANGTAQQPTWYGLTVDGTLLANILSVSGIHADWINTGQLVVTKDGIETLFVDVDTGTVRMSGDSISITSGDALDRAIAQRVTEEISGRNMLYDTNVPTLNPTHPEGGNRVFYNIDTLPTNGTGTVWTEIQNPPIDEIKYGAKHVCTATGGDPHPVLFYYGTDRPDFVTGRTYTVSFMAKTDTDGAQVEIGFVNNSGWDRSTKYTETINVSDGWKLVQLTFKYIYTGRTAAGEPNYSNFYVGSSYNVVGTVYCCGYQLEEGDAATSWSEYPYEYETYGGINLIRNAKTIDLTGSATLPNINGYYNSGHIERSSGTFSAMTHGVKIQNTSGTRTYLRFGSTTTSSSSLFGLIAGETYTFSCDLEVNAFSGSFTATGYRYITASLYTDVRNPNASGTTSTWNSNKEVNLLTYAPTEMGAVKNAHVTFTFTIPENATRMYLMIAPSDTTASHFASGDYISVDNLKIERGNKASDWTAAPEDIDKAIVEAKSIKYGTCTTAAGTKAKVVTAPDFKLETGSQIAVQFSYSNTASNPTLNVNSTGAKAIYAKGAALAAQYYWTANSLIQFTYDGSYWVMEVVDQDEVFKRLTNNGVAQGIFMQDGQLYINMSYLQTGTLKVGGSNNGNGVFEVYNSSGTRTGLWNNGALYVGNVSGTSQSPSSPNTKIDTAGAITTKSLTADDYIYVNGNNNSFVRIPIPIYSSDAAVEIGSSGVTSMSPSKNIYTRLLGSDSNNNVWTYVPGVYCGNKLAYYNATGSGGKYSLMTPDDVSVAKGGETTYTVIEASDFKMVYRSNVLLHFNTSGSSSYDYNFSGDVNISGNFRVASGTKSRIADTEDYGKRLLYAYETPSPLFGDVGEGIISDDGKCYVQIDGIFAETVTLTQYQVFLQKYGDGDCWVSERHTSYFVVEGTPDLSFGWELKAKQSDFDQYRLEPEGLTYINTNSNIDYATELSQHIQDIQHEREVTA